MDYVIHPHNFTLAGQESENKKLGTDDAISDDNDDGDRDEDEWREVEGKGASYVLFLFGFCLIKYT